MFVVHDLHWVAAVLNPRTRLLKLATDTERCHAHSLICSKITKIMELDGADLNQSILSVKTTVRASPSKKKFKSYTAQFDDDVDSTLNTNAMTNSMRARRELDVYLQLDLSNYSYSEQEMDNPLLFWKEQELLLPNLSKLSRQIFSIPASSAAVERSFSAAGLVISQRRTNLSPSTINDILLVRSAAIYHKSKC